MAISAAEIAALPAYTDAELLILYRWCMANGAAGQTRSIGGRVISFPSVEQVMKTIDWLETRVNSSADFNDGTALVRFGEAS